MLISRRLKTRITLVVLVILGIILWHGINVTTAKNFNCEYKLVYAVCKPKTGNPTLPGIFDILKAGIKF